MTERTPINMLSIVEMTDLVRHWSDAQDPGTSVTFTVHFTPSDRYDADHMVSDTFSRIVGPAGALALITSTMISAERKARDNNDFEFADKLLSELKKFNSSFGIDPQVEAATPSRKVQ